MFFVIICTLYVITLYEIYVSAYTLQSCTLPTALRNGRICIKNVQAAMTLILRQSNFIHKSCMTHKTIFSSDTQAEEGAGRLKVY